MSDAQFMGIALLFFVLFVVGVVVGVQIIAPANIVMREAYDRGHAQLCPGVRGYYWRGECPEVAE